MRFASLVLATALFSLPFANLALADGEAGVSDHVSHPKPAHAHGGADCKHKKVGHGDHEDYIHDGQYHALHNDHYDNHGLVAAADSDRKVASNDDLKLDSHDHKHGASCGHKAVKHGSHTDYEHDGHFHAAHGDHFDDHGYIARNAE